MVTAAAPATASADAVRSTDRALRWIAVAAWLALPVTLGGLVADALAGAASTAQLIDGIAAWTGWTIALVALLVPTTVSLTVARVAVPGAVLVAVVAGASVTTASDGGLTAVHLGGAALAAAASVLVLTPQVGSVFVNGSSYGDERRFLLRIPAALLLGPLQLAWAVVAATAVGAPVLAGAERWIAAGALTVLGVPASVLAARALHGLHRRWFVLVPTGVVVHDWSALTESVMAPRRQVAGLGPATADSAALDLTLGAAGLALELRFVDPTSVSPRPPRRPGSGAVVRPVDVRGVLFTPTRPGRLLELATARRLPVG